MQILFIILLLVATFMFAFYVLPVLFPVLIIIWLIAAVRRALTKNQKETEYEEYTTYQKSQPRIQPREARPDSIDVDFVEYEDVETIESGDESQ